MAVGWLAAAVVGSSLISGAMGSNAATSAADTQAAAANNATQTQLQMFQQMRSDLQPYMAEGQVGLDQLGNLIQNPSFVSQLPGYQFQLKQGQDAILNSAAATGLTGNTLKALSDYGQGTASSYLNNYWNQMLGLTQLGQTSAAGVGSAGISTGQNVGANAIGAGNALAAGQVGSASAWSGAMNNGISNFLLANAMGSGAPAAAYNPSLNATLGQTSVAPSYSLVGP